MSNRDNFLEKYGDKEHVFSKLLNNSSSFEKHKVISKNLSIDKPTLQSIIDHKDVDSTTKMSALDHKLVDNKMLTIAAKNNSDPIIRDYANWKINQ